MPEGGLGTERTFNDAFDLVIELRKVGSYDPV
jgi:hypothetical protein